MQAKYDLLALALSNFEDVKVCDMRLIKVREAGDGGWTYVWETMDPTGGFKWVSGTYDDWENDERACTG